MRVMARATFSLIVFFIRVLIVCSETPRKLAAFIMAAFKVFVSYVALTHSTNSCVVIVA